MSGSSIDRLRRILCSWDHRQRSERSEVGAEQRFGLEDSQGALSLCQGSLRCPVVTQRIGAGLFLGLLVGPLARFAVVLSKDAQRREIMGSEQAPGGGVKGLLIHMLLWSSLAGASAAGPRLLASTR